MTVPSELWQQVRQRAGLACEYCGVSEVDTGGLLTVDHFHPKSHGGSDDFANLLYCCHRCNSHKAGYWPIKADDPTLWNPRREAFASHFVLLPEGTLRSITATGSFTLLRLRLNREPLVAYRLRKWQRTESSRLLKRFVAIAELTERIQGHYAALLEEQRNLLAEQRALLRALLKEEE